MAVRLLSHEVSDLCIGKPALKSLPTSATVGEAIVALRLFGETYVCVVESPHRVVGKICMVDILCYLCDQPNLADPFAALNKPAAVLLSKEGVRRVETYSSISEALDLILDTQTHSLIVPISSTKKEVIYCWLTQDDLVRYFLNSISAFSSIAPLSITALSLVQPASLSVRHHEPAISALPLIRSALTDKTAVAVVTDDGKLVGEISPATLSACDETVAAAIASLSAGDLMAYVDCCSGGVLPESYLVAVKKRLREKGMEGMLRLMEEENTYSSSSSVSSLSSSNSSSDEEVWESIVRKRKLRRRRSSGSYSSRMGRRSEEAIVCHPESSLVAVMVQAIAHRVSYVWVVDADYGLVGVVTFQDMLRVFREVVARS